MCMVHAYVVHLHCPLDVHVYGPCICSSLTLVLWMSTCMAFQVSCESESTLLASCQEIQMPQLLNIDIQDTLSGGSVLVELRTYNM